MNRNLVIITLIFLAVVTRLLPHPPNFTPIAGMALFAVNRFSDKKLAFSLPIFCMILTDTFLGFQRNIIGGVNSARPLVTTARGSIITDPVVTGGVPLEVGKLVFLSAVSGEVTQDPQYYDIEGSVLLKLGYAISSRKMALVPDLTVRF